MNAEMTNLNGRTGVSALPSGVMMDGRTGVSALPSGVMMDGRTGVSALPSTDMVSPDALLQAEALPICWRGRPLYPWSSGRDALYLGLSQYRRGAGLAWLAAMENELEVLPLIEAQVRRGIEEDEQATAEEKALVDPEAMIEWARFAPAAARVLWIASTDHARLRAMAPDTMLECVDVWAEEHLPAEELRAAVRLALRLRTEWKQLVVLPRPEKGVNAKGDHAGN